VPSANVLSTDQNEWRWWLALWRAPGVGPKAFARFLEHFHTPQQVFAAPRAQLQALGIKTLLIDYLQNPDWNAVEYDLAWLQGQGRTLLTWHDTRYPERLKAIHNPPPLLFVEGDANILAYAQVAMVGARNPTRGGEENAHEFARYLADLGIIITSGLAEGIDAAAHRGALAANGHTVAVLGTGPDIVYPAKHQKLAQEIAINGALVTEFMPGMPARPGNFPRRNRIISGLSLGVLVVEASIRSGSLITARTAAEQGREVFAIPGSIHNPMAKGCHALLKEGAKLVEIANDIVEELRLYPVPVKVNPLCLPTDDLLLNTNNIDNGLDEDYLRLLEYMGLEEPVSIDLLVERCGFNADMVSSMLLILELRGLVASQNGGRYSRLAQRNPS
jgi:DNA processing protein